MTEDEAFETELVRDGAHLRGIDWLFDDLEELEDLDDEFDEELDDVDALPERDQAIIKGLLWMASVIVVDELFEDVVTLTERAGDDRAWMDTNVIGGLPPRLASDYTQGFARAFLVAAVDVTTRLAGEWSPLPSVAHELALRAVLDKAQAVQETREIELTPGWRSVLEQGLFEDLDHEMLYAETGLKLTLADSAAWFVPFGDVPQAPFATELRDVDE